VDQPREKAVIAVQIWAEAARNPGMARMCADIEGTVIQGLAAAISEAKSNGELPPRLDEALLMAISMMADGFFCRRAGPEFRCRRGGRHALRRHAPARPDHAPARNGDAVVILLRRAFSASVRPYGRNRISSMSLRSIVPLNAMIALALLTMPLPLQAQTAVQAAPAAAGPSVSVTQAR
jgi:hypothetical protein